MSPAGLQIVPHLLLAVLSCVQSSIYSLIRELWQVDVDSPFPYCHSLSAINRHLEPGIGSLAVQASGRPVTDARFIKACQSLPQACIDELPSPGSRYLCSLTHSCWPVRGWRVEVTFKNCSVRWDLHSFASIYSSASKSVLSVTLMDPPVTQWDRTRSIHRAAGLNRQKALIIHCFYSNNY